MSNILQSLFSELDVALVRVIKAVQHLHDRALSRSGRPDNGCRSPHFECEIHIRKDIIDMFGSCGVPKLHITELDTVIELNDINASVRIFIFYRWHSVNDFEDLVGRG